jgi:hypothetical protein
MGLMREFDVVKGDSTLFNPHMAKGGTGYPGLKFPRRITFIDDGKGLFSLTICRIEEFEGIFNIVNALAQKHIAVIVAGFIEKILCLFKIPGVPPALFRFI